MAKLFPIVFEPVGTGGQGIVTVVAIWFERVRGSAKINKNVGGNVARDLFTVD